MTPITFAHRGGAAERPENSVEAFRHATASGASGVESDVRVTADGIPVLVHDARIRRGLRRHRVAETAAADLEDLGVSSLADLYAAVDPSMHVSLDLKVAGAAAPAIDVARSVGAPQRLWLCSPDLEMLLSLREEHADVRLVHSTTRSAVGDSLERHAARLAESGIDAFNLHRTEWSEGLVVLFHRFEVAAFAWDVQEVRHLRAVLDCGVDAVYSDHVTRMVAVVAEFTAGGA